MNAKFRAIFYTAICCTFSLSVAAQNNSLAGKVLFLNSDKTPAVGIEISGSIRIDSTTTINANPVYTDTDGSYTLVFPKAVPGHVVEIKVGDKDGNGQVLEIINEEELRICRIPKDLAEEFEIIVCKKGERDIAAKKYYNILKTSADRELDRMKKEWSALVDQSEKDYEKINTMSKRIDALQKQTDSLKLYKDALRIASINKDNATKRVLRYLKLLDEGTSIQEARKALSINKAIDELEVGILRFNAAVTELQTRATASKSIFDYKDAIKCYDTLISYSEKMGVDGLKMTQYYEEIALIFSDDGKYTNTLKYQQKAIEIREKLSDLCNPCLAIAYHNIAHTYQHLGQYQDALNYQQKAVGIQQEILNPKHSDLANSYHNIGVIYGFLGQHEEALKYQQKALAINENILNHKHPLLATVYGSIGNTYQLLGQYEEALKYQQKALAIDKDILDHKHPDLAATYNNIGTCYMLLGRYEIALKYQQKAIAIVEEILDPKHPNLAIAYSNVGLTYSNLGEYRKALKYFQKTLKIRQEVLNPKHPDLASAYIGIGSLYRFLGQYENALKYQQRAIYIIEEALDSKHPDLAIYYRGIAWTYARMRQYETALKYHQTALKIQEVALNPKHPELAKSYKDISDVYTVLGQHEKSLNYIQKAIDIQEDILDPKHLDLGVSYWVAGVTHKKMKDFQKAIFFQKKCINVFKEAFPKDHPYQKRVLNTMAEIYYASKNYHQAIKTYQNVAEVFPEIKKQHFYNNIGLAYVKNKQFKEAKDAFSKYEKLFPKKGITYRNWAMYYALQNEKEKALKNLQKGVELGYKNAEWLKTDDSMDGLRGEKVFIEILEKLEKEQSKKKP